MLIELCEEMIKFRNYLDENKIEWKDASDLASSIIEDFAIYRTHFYYKGNRISVINGYCTYGGYNKFINDGKNEGLLEVMIGSNEPKGWLTAEEAIEYIFE